MGEIKDIQRQFREGGWKQFLTSIKITNLRGWDGQIIDFLFPVTAFVGENGMGKSTVLRAAACAYQSKRYDFFNYYPSTFFINTQWDAKALDGATIEYDVKHGDISSKKFRWRKTKDWGFSPKREKVKRDVHFLDITRTMPLDAMAGYAKLARQSQHEGTSNINIDADHLQCISHVLGRKYLSARFTNTDFHENKEVGLLEQDFGEVSQFHQGAGEDTILDIFKLIQSLKDQSLLIIDEVENSLHPLAQRRLIKELLHLSRVKKIQIILSTHSPFILEELPPEARVLIMKDHSTKQIIRNISAHFALTNIDEQAHPELYIYVEDEAAKTLLHEIIRTKDPVDNYLLKRVEVKSVGAADVVNTLSRLTRDDKLSHKAIAFVDGDKREEFPDCFSLPGDEAPEKMILLDLKEKNWGRLDEVFGIGAGSLFKIFDDVILLRDHHDWMRRIGDQTKTNMDHVWITLAREWCRICLETAIRDEIIATIEEHLY